MSLLNPSHNPCNRHTLLGTLRELLCDIAGFLVLDIFADRQNTLSKQVESSFDFPMHHIVSLSGKSHVICGTLPIFCLSQNPGWWGERLGTDNALLGGSDNVPWLIYDCNTRCISTFKSHLITGLFSSVLCTSL